MDMRPEQPKPQNVPMQSLRCSGKAGKMGTRPQAKNETDNEVRGGEMNNVAHKATKQQKVNAVEIAYTWLTEGTGKAADKLVDDVLNCPQSGWEDTSADTFKEAISVFDEFDEDVQAIPFEEWGFYAKALSALATYLHPDVAGDAAWQCANKLVDLRDLTREFAR